MTACDPTPPLPPPLSDPSPDWLAALLRDVLAPEREAPARVAERPTEHSRSFDHDKTEHDAARGPLPASRHHALARDSLAADPAPAPDEAAPPWTAPKARAMLGWADPEPEAGDAFAARLMAAFESGAFDLKPRMAIATPAERRPAVAPGASSGTPKRPVPRAQAHTRPDAKHQTYASQGSIARPLYTPW